MRITLAVLLSLALSLACGGSAEIEQPPPPDPPQPIVVPIVDDGREHFCCEYTEDGQQRFELLPHARACLNRFGDLGGKWVEGDQCLPCCCESAVSPTDPSQGVRRELTVPGQCAGVGQCVVSDAPECRLPLPAERPGQGRPDPGRPVRPGPAPEDPTRDPEIIKPKNPGGGGGPPDGGKKGKRKAG